MSSSNNGGYGASSVKNSNMAVIREAMSTDGGFKGLEGITAGSSDYIVLPLGEAQIVDLCSSPTITDWRNIWWSFSLNNLLKFLRRERSQPKCRHSDSADRFIEVNVRVTEWMSTWRLTVVLVPFWLQSFSHVTAKESLVCMKYFFLLQDGFQTVLYLRLLHWDDLSNVNSLPHASH